MEVFPKPLFFPPLLFLSCASKLEARITRDVVCRVDPVGLAEARLDIADRAVRLRGEVRVREERRRIVDAGGEVHAAADGRPARVYFANGSGPGLATSRSVGEHRARRIGITCEPHTERHERRPCDKLLLLASEG